MRSRAYRFVRADRMGSKDDLIALAISKGRQIIDEQGTGIFN
ncbi:HlyU family transcriptional regulator [Devosia algicola]|uniref:HlyU family transcriptional regulator n=1 Tax=Devosia algicola TaxID=3026418 RepID=A0ABY7YS04_9HYPH|nr:HlyU family transcriptional regulator [Devosia algicola]